MLNGYRKNAPAPPVRQAARCGPCDCSPGLSRSFPGASTGQVAPPSRPGCYRGEPTTPRTDLASAGPLNLCVTHNEPAGEEMGNLWRNSIQSAPLSGSFFASQPDPSCHLTASRRSLRRFVASCLGLRAQPALCPRGGLPLAGPGEKCGLTVHRYSARRAKGAGCAREPDAEIARAVVRR